ncbi:MAG: hypothetical protein KGL39_38770 [Patescibacteria group bacterium]|nr:hypothetical protein [Patescibacteria group bacterium]
MSDEKLEQMMQRFLTWPLPDSVCSDPCARMQGYPHRSGTNLLSADEATQMLKHVVGDELAALRAQLAERDARIKELTEAVRTVLGMHKLTLTHTPACYIGYGPKRHLRCRCVIRRLTDILAKDDQT